MLAQPVLARGLGSSRLTRCGTAEAKLLRRSLGPRHRGGTLASFRDPIAASYTLCVVSDTLSCGEWVAPALCCSFRHGKGLNASTVGPAAESPLVQVPQNWSLFCWQEPGAMAAANVYGVIVARGAWDMAVSHLHVPLAASLPCDARSRSRERSSRHDVRRPCRAHGCTGTPTPLQSALSPTPLSCSTHAVAVGAR